MEKLFKTSRLLDLFRGVEKPCILDKEIHFDASLAVVAMDAVSSTENPIENVVEETVEEAPTENVVEETVEEAPTENVVEESEISDSTDLIVENDSEIVNEIFVIDKLVDQYENLVDDISEDAEILYIESGEGLEELLTKLSKFNKIDSLHLISHGSEGQLNIGQDLINLQTIEDYSEGFNELKDLFSANGDFLIYGCNVATADGEALVDRISVLTGSDVAASDDLTGSKEFGGDFNLEYETGEIESEGFNDFNYNFNSVLANQTLYNDLFDVNHIDWTQSTSGGGAIIQDVGADFRRLGVSNDTNIRSNTVVYNPTTPLEGNYSIDFTIDQINLNTNFDGTSAAGTRSFTTQFIYSNGESEAINFIHAHDEKPRDVSYTWVANDGSRFDLSSEWNRTTLTDFSLVRNEGVVSLTINGTTIGTVTNNTANLSSIRLRSFAGGKVFLHADIGDITVIDLNDKPIITSTSVGDVAYTEHDPAITIDSHIALNDIDDTNLTSATVSITAHHESTDILSFTNTANVSGAFNAATGVLTVTGTATVAEYQTFMRSVSYSSSSEFPSETTRAINFIVNDGTSDSDVYSRNVTVDEVNDKPIANNDNVNGNQNVDLIINPLGNDTDADDGFKIISASVPVGTLSFTDSSITYNSGASASDVVITYTIEDARGELSTASIQVAITPTPPPIELLKSPEPEKSDEIVIQSFSEPTNLLAIAEGEYFVDNSGDLSNIAEGEYSTREDELSLLASLSSPTSNPFSSIKNAILN
mgnify:CR=1 FL=1